MMIVALAVLVVLAVLTLAVLFTAWVWTPRDQSVMVSYSDPQQRRALVSYTDLKQKLGLLGLAGDGRMRRVADACPALPVDLMLPSQYLDTPCRCERDPGADAQLKALRAPLGAFRDWLAKTATAVATGAASPDTISRAIEAQAAAGALLGNVSPQGRVDCMLLMVRVYTAAARLPSPPSAAVSAWLGAHAQNVAATFLTRITNLRVWGLLCLVLAQQAGVAVPPVPGGLAQVWVDVCAGIRDDGGLPSEDARGSRATEYYEYFLHPLVVSACLLRVDHPRLHVLVDRVLSLDRTLLPARMPWTYIYKKVYGTTRVTRSALLDAEAAKVDAGRFTSAWGEPPAWLF